MKMGKLVAAVAVLGAAGAAFAWSNPFTNAGFEDGDLTGWSSYVPSSWNGATKAATYQEYGTLDWNTWTYPRMYAHDGDYFGVAEAGDVNQYTELWQTVSLNKLDLVSGYAFFATYDYWPFNDDGQVYVLSGDEDGSVASTALSENVGSVGDYGTSGWQYWEFEAASAGTYTLLARVRNILDSGVDSFVGLDGVDFEPGLIEVTFDVKPDSSDNEINLKSKGVIPCAILGSADFDVDDVDVSSLSFGPNGVGEDHGKGHYEDANDDGITDLVLHFDTQACGIAAGDTSVTLTGKTTDGVDLTGTDTISTK